MSLICPKCEKPLDEHDEGGCRRKLSRRFFLGALGTSLAAAAAAQYLPNVEIKKQAPGQLVVEAAPKVHRSATITLTTSGSSGRENMIALVEHIAATRGVPVIAIEDGDVIHYVDPIKEQTLANSSNFTVPNWNFEDTTEGMMEKWRREKKKY
jgi:hypothetical protein